MPSTYVWTKRTPAGSADVWEERLRDRPGAVFNIPPSGKSMRIEVYCDTAEEAGAIAAEWGGKVRRLEPQNWAALAPPPAAPIKIRDALLVTPDEDPRQIEALRAEHPGRSVICIPPELAFGTGDHATTATCLRLTADAARGFRRAGHGWSMLDIGTGTGLLAIAALKLGATRAEGFDFDPAAIRVAERNAERNGLAGDRRLKLSRADLFDWRPGRRRWDLVAANVFADILCAHLDKIRDALAPGGVWMLSGILRAHEAAVREAADEAGLPEPCAVRVGKWVTLHGTAPRPRLG